MLVSWQKKILNFGKNRLIINKLRLFWLSLILLIVLLFLWLKIVPLGRISYYQDYDRRFRSGKGFVYNFTPAERVDKTNSRYPRIVGDPVYFSVFTPRTFSRAKLTLIYRDTLDEATPLIEAGVLADRMVWRYDLRPLENRRLAEIVATRQPLSGEGNLVVWQRNNNYKMIDEFWRDLATGRLLDCETGPAACLATYNYHLDSVIVNQIDNENKIKQTQILDLPLRGTHVLLFNFAGGSFLLQAGFVDLNQDKLADPIRVLLFRGQELISEQELSDENLYPTDGIEEKKELVLEMASLEPGVYKAEIKISDDVIIDGLKISAQNLSFANKVWPVSVSGPISLFTDAPYLQTKILDPANLQTIKFGGQSFKLDKAYEQSELTLNDSSEVNKIELLKSDIILENNSVFAFSSEDLFNPRPKKVDRYFFLQPAINYIIADYASPERQNDWKVASAEFITKGAYRENGRYNFMISIPGLKASNSDRYLEVKEVRLEFSGRSLWQKILNIPDK